MTKANYFAFISYSHVDKKWSRWLHRKLESYKIPKNLVGQATSGGHIPARLTPIFRDREDLPSSTDLSASVIDALKRSANLIVICSPHAARSPWVNEEILNFKLLKGAERIFCVIVGGEPNSANPELECFPEALQMHYDAEGQKRPDAMEPIAADVRPEGDGRQLARLKLIAGLVGVSLDDLRQRDMHRRHRRMAAITVASLAGMALTILLALVAYDARDEARQRREQAEDLISFMLGDLRERLSDVGRLDILDSVAGKVLDYFAELPPGELDNDALARRAETLRQLGQVQLDRGELDAAMEFFDESLLAAEALGQREQDNLARLFDLAQAHFWVGYVHWQSGDLGAAEESMQIYHEISEKLHTTRPGNEAYELELGYAYQTLASLSKRLGKLEAALEYSQRHIDISREVFERDSQNETSRKSLAYAYSLNGSILHGLGKMAESLELFSNYLDLAKEASHDDPGDMQWHEDQMLAHHFVANVSLDLGDSRQARKHYKKAGELADLLIGIEPENDFWQKERAILLIARSGEVTRDGNFERGLEILDAARQQADDRLTKNPDNPGWLEIKADIELEAGRRHLENLDLESARLAAQQALGRTRMLAGQDADNTRIRSLLANCLILTGRISAARGSQEQALDAWAEALDVLGEDTEASSNPELLAPLVRASWYLDRADEVLPLVNRLHASGYRHPGFVASCGENKIEC
jgi:tetratricopeptide (TPR) repeat protein